MSGGVVTRTGHAKQGREEDGDRGVNHLVNGDGKSRGTDRPPDTGTVRKGMGNPIHAHTRARWTNSFNGVIIPDSVEGAFLNDSIESAIHCGSIEDVNRRVSGVVLK